MEDDETIENSYVVETKDGMTHIPYEQIYFFEAREKKIYVCIGKEAYGFYGTIDKLVEELPSNFVRCHRGFIVNKNRIDRVVLSQNIIYLEDGFDVPLSRSYKPLFKGMRKYEQ
jgi:DNA-binding LytR/AlgR family response regulator